MGQIFGILGELIPLVAGVYCILYFGGYQTPKYNDESQKLKFEELKDKHGKKFYFGGIFLAFYGAYGIIQILL